MLGQLTKSTDHPSWLAVSNKRERFGTPSSRHSQQEAEEGPGSKIGVGGT